MSHAYLGLILVVLQGYLLNLDAVEKPLPLISLHIQEGTPHVDRVGKNHARRKYLDVVWSAHYQEAGVKNKLWDSKAMTYLKACARDYGTESMVYPTESRIVAGKAAIAAGCDDPLVVLLTALDDKPNDHWADFQRCWPLLKVQQYSGLARLRVFRSYMSRPMYQTPERFLLLSQAMVEAVHDSITDPVVVSNEFYYYLTEWLGEDLYNNNGKNGLWDELAKPMPNLPENVIWAGKVVNGIAHMHLAGCLGKSIDEIRLNLSNGGFVKQDIAAARTSFEEAAELKPKSILPFYWQLRLAAFDPSISNAVELLGRGLEADMSFNSLGVVYIMWLDLYRPQDVTARVDLLSLMSKLGLNWVDLVYQLPIDWFQSNPELVQKILAEQRYQDALGPAAEADFYTHQKLKDHDQKTSYTSSRVACLFHMMGKTEAAGAYALRATDKDLLRAIPLLQLQVTPAELRAGAKEGTGTKAKDF